MSIVSRYLLSVFVMHFVVLLGAVVAFLALFDLMLHADEVIVTGGGGALSLFRYLYLRLPEVISQVLPLAVLVSSLLAMVRLARNSELVAMMAAGISQFRLLAALLPAALVISGSQLVLEDQLVPAGIRALTDWGVGDYRIGSRDGALRVTWARDGNDVVRVRRVFGAGDRLGGVTLFKRDDDGALTERIDAKSAQFADGAWILRDVTRLNIADNLATHEATMTWSGKLRPKLLSALSKHPRELSLREIKRFVDDPGTGNRPLYYYQTWFNEKISAPLTPILMILLAVALIQFIRTRGSAGPIITVGIAIGLFYIVLNQLSLASGEAGLVPPIAAAWIPTLVFASVGGAIAFRAERR